MTTMYARFIIGKNDWRSSNQRLNPVMDGLRSKRIQDYAEKVWRAELLKQFHLVPMEPVCDMDQHVDMPVDNERTRVMEHRLDELRSEREDWDKKNKSILPSLKKNDPGQYEFLIKERLRIRESISRQHKALTLERGRIRKNNRKEGRILQRSADKRLVEERLLLNKDRRLFTSPVRFNIRVHNISKHFFDSCNSWPTIKPLQDAATRTGVIWDDDNNACIPITTFRGGEMLGHDYVIDIIIESMDEPLSLDPFKAYDSIFDSLPSSL